jgi:hypothetical protein
MLEMALLLIVVEYELKALRTTFQYLTRSVTVEWLVLLSDVQEVMDSNIVPLTGYPTPDLS